MAAVSMYVEKFGKVVTIDEDHPLAVAQRERDALGSSPRTPAAQSDTRPDDAEPGVAIDAGNGAGDGEERPQEKGPTTVAKLRKLSDRSLVKLAARRGVSIPEGSTRKEIIALLVVAE
jgi:hypothetical protein